MSGTAAKSAAAGERREIVAVARTLGRRELAPRALELDERRPAALQAAWERLVEVGFDRALVPVENGGAGLDPETLLLCLEEIAAGDGGVAILTLLSNAALAVLPLELVAGAPAGERWALLPAPPRELATGARVHARGEPAAGGLEGELNPALGALGADGLAVIVPEPEPAVFAFPAGSAGVEVTAAEPQLGLRAAGAARVSFSEHAEGIATPAADAAVAAAQSIVLLRSGAAAIARGVARRAQELALEYAETRMQGGAPILRHDAVREMLAAMEIRLAASPCPTETIEAVAASVIATKVANTDAAVATTTDAVQVFGGSGYMHETGIEKLMRDAKHLQLWPEPNWVGRGLIAGALRAPSGTAAQA